MNDERGIQLRKWQRLLVFAAGSILTALVATIDSGGHPMNGRTPLIGTVLLFWTLFGAGTGVWFIVGPRWRQTARDARLQLGVSYLAVAWSGLAAMLWTVAPVGSALIVLSGIPLALFFIMQKRDESDTFP